jgi:integrase
MPDALHADLEGYLAWYRQPYAKKRPATLIKRPVSEKMVRDAVRAIGGYAVHIKRMDPSTLTLATLTVHDLVDAFVEWWMNERRGQQTRSIKDMLGQLCTISEHWLPHTDKAHASDYETRTKELRTLKRTIGRTYAVWDKDVSLMALRDLEQVGLACYPLNAARLETSQYARAVVRYLNDPVASPLPRETGQSTLYCYTSQVQMSLIIRLLVRIPLRQRNIREMRLDRNLLRTSHGFDVRFVGKELKIGFRDGKENVYQRPIPDDLVPLVEEWLTVWRPRRLNGLDSPFVFVNRQCGPFTSEMLKETFKRTVYRFTGQYMTPHLVRDSWATEYLAEEGDVAGAAEMLGDTVETVIRHYAHILRRRAQDETGKWLQNHLQKDRAGGK